MDILVLISYLSLAAVGISTVAYVYFDRKSFVNDRIVAIVLGLMISRSLTNSAVVGILMWYFSYYEGNLVLSAVFSNIQDSLSSLLVIFMANLSDSFFGRFRTLLFSTTAYIGGVFLLYLFNPYDVKWLIVIALVLLALGTSGYKVLDEVLIELVDDIDTLKKPATLKNRDPELMDNVDTSEERKQLSKERAEIWSRIAYVSGTIIAILWVSPSGLAGVYLTWRAIFLICICFMTTQLIVFIRGYKLYYQEELNQRPAMIFFRVIGHYIGKYLCKCDCGCTAKRKHSGTTQKAEGQDDRNANLHKQDMAKVKILLKIFPMWVSYFVVALISATGSTFFIEQYSNLKTSNKLPVQIYNNLIQEGSKFLIPIIYKKVTCSRRNNQKVKIGVGMFCSIVCCISAWQLEVHRLKAVKKLVDQNANTSISFLLLVPQFLLLGCMEGLTNDGLSEFFKSQVDKDLEKYGEDYIEVVLGVGKLFTIALILIFKSRLGWFGKTINDSRLDKYYIFLVCVCSVNFLCYCCIATFWFK
uniref:protein NRT1/ PTR FAMILY 5.8-like n=1 Tax=Erigeron canadensis TaxID=72917 RepID=UPI001CB88F6F|nr:protein NRT1/ PTR FAMILY 5.8-like [Erigeron canadensis]